MTDAPGPRQRLRETIDTQRLGCELAGSPLYAEVLSVIDREVAAGGRSAELLDPVADAPFGDAVLLRLLAGLHLAVLEGTAPDLAAHYPSVGGAPGRGLAKAVVATIEEHHVALADALQRGVQTNEVGRSASLLGGYLEVARAGLPLRVFEVGASAGLNLCFDRFHYSTSGAGSFGDPASPLHFESPWFGAAPDLSIPLTVAERHGCDVAPLDVTDAADRRRLRSFVWADQCERMARLDAAIEVASSHPPSVAQAPAPEWLEQVLAEPAPGTATVVVHSIVFQYLGAEARTRMLDAIDDAGSRATPDAPLAWLRLEPGGDQAELRLTQWPGGPTRVLATSAYHGPPVVWRSA